jgi:hypothetical protein
MTTVRVFINGAGVDAPAGGTVLEAVRVWDPGVAEGLEHGERRLTDSRGLPIGTDVPVFAGAIFRVLPARSRTADDIAS